MSGLKENEVVWAKIKGYPWWPAYFKEMIKYKSEEVAKVKFIGHNTYGLPPISQIASYQENRSKYGNTKKKDLIKSIEIADMVISQELNIKCEDEVNSTVNTFEFKECLKKRKLMILDDEDESICKGSREHKIQSLDDAMGMIKKLIRVKNVGLVNSMHDELLSALGIIKREKDKNEVKIVQSDLKAFAALYRNESSLKKFIELVDEILENNKRSVVYEHIILNSSNTLSRRLKRLKYEESDIEGEIEENLEIDAKIPQNEINKEKPKNFKLMALICQETAKLLAEVTYKNK